jgi:hypothetical protein
LRSDEDEAVELVGGGDADMGELDVDAPFEQFTTQLRSAQATTARMT